MEELGVRTRHRAPALHGPGREYVQAGLMLIFTAGLTAGGAWEAHKAGDAVWYVILVSLTLAACGVYFQVVSWLISWLNLSGD